MLVVPVTAIDLMIQTVHPLLQVLKLPIPYLDTDMEHMVMHDRGTSPKHTSTATSSPVYRSVKIVTKKLHHSFPLGGITFILVK